MRDGIVFTRVGLAACVTAAVIATCTVVVMAQAATEAPGAGSLAAVTAELRQLRLAVEESTRSQTQTHALGVYLSAQQSRLVQVSARLDAARRELDAVTIRSRETSTDLANTEDALLRVAKPEAKSQLEMQGRMLKHELDKVAPQLQQAQTREAELSQMLQAEEARWTDLIARLEQLVRK